MTMMLGPSKAVLAGQFDEQPTGDVPVVTADDAGESAEAAAGTVRTRAPRPSPPTVPPRARTRPPPTVPRRRPATSPRRSRGRRDRRRRRRERRRGRRRARRAGRSAEAADAPSPPRAASRPPPSGRARRVAASRPADRRAHGRAGPATAAAGRGSPAGTSLLYCSARDAEDEDPFRREEALQDDRHRQGHAAATPSRATSSRRSRRSASATSASPSILQPTTTPSASRSCWERTTK